MENTALIVHPPSSEGGRCPSLSLSLSLPYLYVECLYLWNVMSAAGPPNFEQLTSASSYCSRVVLASLLLRIQCGASWTLVEALAWTIIAHV